jgi:hypothetical protein
MAPHPPGPDLAEIDLIELIEIDLEAVEEATDPALLRAQLRR